MANTTDVKLKWEPLDSEQKELDRIDRPSLSYWEDSWRRLKQNKSAMLALVIITIIILSAIIVPSFWDFSYEDQNLALSNIPPSLDIYKLDENNFIYITNEYKAIEVSEDGELFNMAELMRDDKQNREYIFKVNDKPLIVDYSLFFKAKSEFINLQKRMRLDETIRSGDVEFLKRHFTDANDHEQMLSLTQIENILEKDIKRFEVKYDGEVVNPFKSVSNKTYIWGSDSLGRDIFIRVIYGARVSLTVGFVAAIINFVIGVFYGGIAGYFGGRVDNIMMRIVDIISSIPMMLYVILIIVILEPGLKSIIIAMSITYWVGMARIVRGQVLSLREQEFVLAAKVLGGDTRRILSKHLIPNVMGPIMVSLTMQIPSAMFTEAFLSFVGLGVSAPKASWGTLCNDALLGLLTYPYQMFFPALAMSITILAFNIFSDGLRDALDPRLRK